ncbi:MAG: T9SS type A sorting domain-containing protein, partial [Chitinophagaceae bacterium]
GGGGGGTIIIDAANYTGAVTIEANGGDGGDTNDGGNIGKCYAGGGGGSGGVIYFNGSLPAITNTVTAGLAGTEVGRDASCNAANPAAPGNAGQIITGYTYRASVSIAGYCSLILPTQLIFFKATPSQKKILLQWQVADPELFSTYVIEKRNERNEWETIGNMPGNDIQEDYSFTDNNPAPGYNLYRIKTIKKTNAVSYSSVRRAYIENDNDKIVVYPNPASNKFFIKNSTGGMINIRLMDISGKIVLQKSMLVYNTTEVDLPSLPSGIYMLHINDLVKKLIIK